jgi:cytosine/uracil/thiamine/allantoin permease
MMAPSKRIAILGIIIEAGLAGLAWYLVTQLRTGAMQPSGTLEQAVSTILQTIGSVMGALAGVLIVAWFVLRRKERAG